MPVKFTNNAAGILATSITNTTTAVTLTTGQGVLFPTLVSGDYCFVTLVDPSNNFEIVKVTGRIGDVLTVIRAQDGTTSKSFPAGSRCELRVTAAAINSVVAELTADVNIKAPITSPQLLGTPEAPTPAAGSNTTQIATTAFVTAALQAMYPVGSIYINAASTSNPSSLIGFGTWVEFGAGRVLIGQNTSDTLFDTLEETGGSKDAIVVAHTHTFSGSGTTSGVGDHQHWAGSVGTGSTYGAWYSSGNSQTHQTQPAGAHSHTFSYSGTTSTNGSSGTDANIQPYITVKMWKRTA